MEKDDGPAVRNEVEQLQEDAVAAMSYREMQRACKAWGRARHFPVK